jgi:ribosome-associated translation inhibitor RaiA
MKLNLRNIQEDWREPVEKETRRHTSKLERLLKKYDPDSLQLHGDIGKHPRKETYTFSINLSLPSGVLHATGQGADVLACVKAGFAELGNQVKKHQALLRKDYEWKRKRPHTRALA